MNYKGIALGLLAFVVRVAIAATVIYYVYEAAFQAYNFGYEVFIDAPYALAPGRDISITVSDPTDYKKMSQDFQDAGLVKDWKLFYVQLFFSEYKDELEAGSYVLNNSMTSQDMLYAMTPESKEEVSEDEGDVVDTSEDMTEVMTEEEMKDGTVYTGGDIVDNAGEDIAPEDIGEGEGGE